MKVIRLYNIQWDTDGEDPTELGLPSECIAIVDDDCDPVEDAADLLCRSISDSASTVCLQGVDPSEAHRELVSSWTTAA